MGGDNLYDNIVPVAPNVEELKEHHVSLWEAGATQVEVWVKFEFPNKLEKC
jgi:hypothetical protein